MAMSRHSASNNPSNTSSGNSSDGPLNIRQPRRKPEVMSPVGGHAQLKAAVEAGADAVFFGVNPPEQSRADGTKSATKAGFHARAKVGFEAEALPDIMRELHRRGVMGFVTFNILVFDRELREAERQLHFLAEAGVDAIIVQDLGVARLAHRIVPDLPIHGSTQMSITSYEGAELAARFGASRVVLGRELSLTDIGRIAKSIETGHAGNAGNTDTKPIELETFVHGALCVSYSGQCFSSEAWGGRSANRGQCAQACRLPYQMLVDGVHRDLGDARYLLSPGDLYALHQVPELVRLGIHCLKIEGRYKDADFVALTTAAYRKAVDEAHAGLPLSMTEQEEQDLEQVYSRGLGPYFMSGTDHQKVVRGRAPRHRGVQVGEVCGLTERGVLVALSKEVKAGDGLVFDPANWRAPEGREEGGFVYQVNVLTPQTTKSTKSSQRASQRTAQPTHELRFAREAIDQNQIRVGDPVWRTHDPSLLSRVKPLLDSADPMFTRPIWAHFVGQVGQPPQLTLSDEHGRSVTVTASEELSQARNRALDNQALQDKLSKLGGTGYHLAELRSELCGSGFLPVSALNALRREAVAQLDELRSAQTVAGRTVTPTATLGTLATVETQATQRTQGAQPAQTRPTQPTQAHPTQLHALVRTPEQLEAVLEWRPDSVTLDYLELYGLKPSVKRIKTAGVQARVASPRILKPTEQNLQKFLLSLETDILLRSGGLLQGLTKVINDTPSESLPALIGDFSLNVANVLTARALLGLGLQRVTPTHDLNARQITELAALVGPERLEVIAYQHLPVFHTEHCVFCRFLSSGTDYTNCGHPCEQHRVALRDSRGIAHPVMADVGCRNTVFEGRPQVAAKHLEAWRAAGLHHFRLEFVHETAEEVHEVMRAFGAFMADELSGAELEQRLDAVAEQGVTEGSLFVPDGYGANSGYDFAELDFTDLVALTMLGDDSLG